jgi:hypothetical protein
MRIIDIAGKKFGMLSVLKYSHTRDGRAFWDCLCSCGNEVNVRGDCLRNGGTKSCGCLRNLSSSGTGENSHRWEGGRVSNGEGYVLVMAPGHPRGKKSGYVYEHVLVAERALGEYIPRNHVIHHINGIKDDNRLENLWWFPSKAEHTRHHAKLNHGGKNGNSQDH